MLDGLAILATAAALIGALQTASRDTAIWAAISIAASGVMATLMAALMAAAVGVTVVMPYAPVLIVVAAATCSGFSASLITRYSTLAADVSVVTPVGLLAAGTSWMVLAYTPSLWGGLGGSLLAGAACGLFMLAGAALRTSRLRDVGIAPIALALSVVLLALSAVA